MKFEWDNKKNETNRDKHGIDFETARKLWMDQFRVDILAPYPNEDRRILLGRLKGKVWAAIYTLRGDSVRIISVRRARKREVELYEG